MPICRIASAASSLRAPSTGASCSPSVPAEPCMYASRSAYVSYEVTVRSDAMASRNSSTRCTGMSQVCMVCSSVRPTSRRQQQRGQVERLVVLGQQLLAPQVALPEARVTDAGGIELIGHDCPWYAINTSSSSPERSSYRECRSRLASATIAAPSARAVSVRTRGGGDSTNSTSPRAGSPCWGPSSTRSGGIRLRV